MIATLRPFPHSSAVVDAEIVQRLNAAPCSSQGSSTSVVWAWSCV